RLGVEGRFGSDGRAVGGAEVIFPFLEGNRDVTIVVALDPAAVGGAAGVVAPGVAERDGVASQIDADHGVDVTLDDVVAVLKVGEGPVGHRGDGLAGVECVGDLAEAGGRVPVAPLLRGEVELREDVLRVSAGDV